MTAEIIQFPMRRDEDGLVSAIIRLEEIVREVEYLAEQPADGLHHLLTVMERLGDQLNESSSLLLDDHAKCRVQTAFASLSAKIAEAREAFDELGRSKHP